LIPCPFLNEGHFINAAIQRKFLPKSVGGIDDFGAEKTPATNGVRQIGLRRRIGCQCPLQQNGDFGAQRPLLLFCPDFQTEIQLIGHVSDMQNGIFGGNDTIAIVPPPAPARSPRLSPVNLTVALGLFNPDDL